MRSVEVGADEIGTPTSNLIDGKWVPATSGRTFQLCNPADDIVVSEVPVCGEEDVRAAIEAADRAFARVTQGGPRRLWDLIDGCTTSGPTSVVLSETALV
jgi:alpha-ketoglutaric semialdehyde dehydrogenase